MVEVRTGASGAEAGSGGVESELAIKKNGDQTDESGRNESEGFWVLR